MRLIKRLRRHREDLFTFVDQPGVPFDNNHAERMVRPAVIIRKNSYGNRSERGADCQVVLMSIFRTLKQQGHDPIRTITNALAGLHQNRQTSAAASKHPFRWLKCYHKSIFARTQHFQTNHLAPFEK